MSNSHHALSPVVEVLEVEEARPGHADPQLEAAGTATTWLQPPPASCNVGK